MTVLIRCFLVLLLLNSSAYAQVRLVVVKTGSDQNIGSKASPFASIEKAIQVALTKKNQSVSIEIGAGIYELSQTLEINSENFRLLSLAIRGAERGKVIITGSQQIFPKWSVHKGRILKASLNFNGTAPDQLFINGKALPMARYPNYDPSARNYYGTAADAISAERIRRWAHPQGAYIHALHNGEWGGFHFQITGKANDSTLKTIGGWQNNRPAPMHPKHRFVENILEELDAPGEWFFDPVQEVLYLYPPENLNLALAKIAVSRLTDLVHLIGSTEKPLKNISISNLVFTQNSRSFMETKEPLLRSDWTIYRGAAILLDGTENISISNCEFRELGGNAVFLSNYNKTAFIKNNHFFQLGASAILFIGNPEAVKSPAFRYEEFVPWNKMDFSAGPKTQNFPQYCVAEGNLIHQTGRIEKQSAGVQISMAAHITIADNSIYDVPRAGINIGDGCWGGHVIEHNDVFNTVLETGDHGAFNSWGRDRFWRPERNIIDSIVETRPGIEFLDVVDPIIIRNNRFQCDHGWDIDLDDGSSNYQIYNNLCLSGGIKLREGYHRTVTNNIIINNSFHPHVWLKNSDDVFVRNIITMAYSPIQISEWGKRVDSNFFLIADGLSKSHSYGIDKNSLTGDVQFIDPDRGDFSIHKNSSAHNIGIKNFPMIFGVRDPYLKGKAESPQVNKLITRVGEKQSEKIEWLGAIFKNIESLGERSAAGLPNNNGALLIGFGEKSVAQSSGLQKGDVIVRLGNEGVNSISDLLKIYQGVKWMGQSDCRIIRNQKEMNLVLSFKKE